MAPIGAETIGEGVETVRCSDGEDLELPKKLEFLQTVLSDHFSTLGQVGLVAIASYDDESVSKGKIVATAFRVAPDAAEIKLGKLVAKMKNGEAEKIKVVDGVVEPGDRIRWIVKLKGLPALDALLEGCWNLELILFVSDEVPS